MLLVTITTPTRELADGIAAALVERRLAACAQVAGPVASVYRWRGAVESAQEWVVTAKTTGERFDDLAAAVRALHPYEVPEIVAAPVTRALDAYAAWVAGETAPTVGGVS